MSKESENAREDLGVDAASGDGGLGNEAADTDVSRVADSIAAAAGMTEYSERLIQRAKGLGCPAFRGSRVYVDELAAYIEENNLEALERAFAEDDEITVEIKRERLRNIRFRNDVEESKYIPKERIAGMVQDLGADLKRRLRAALEDDLPPRIQGKAAEDIRPVMRETVDALCNQFAKGTKAWRTK